LHNQLLKVMLLLKVSHLEKKRTPMPSLPPLLPLPLLLE
jgi:hypothetical protein